MDRNNVFKNTILLTLSGIIAKTVDFLFRTLYTRQLGSEGAGLLSLVFSTHSIMLTLATAGISVAVAKVISSCVATHNMSFAKKTMRTALSSTLLCSTIVLITVFTLSDKISENILKDSRTKIPLLLFAPSILFMGLSYCFKGYFYSVRKILIPASSEFIEQFFKITSITYLISFWLPQGIEYGVRAVFLGLTIGEASSFLYLFLFYIYDTKNIPLINKTERKHSALLPLLKISIPALVTSLSGSYLHMKEELLIVSGLKKYGFSPSSALSAYGTISGMVLPLTLFPLSLLSSFLTLLVPEISRASERINNIRLLDLSQKVYKFASFGAFLIAAVFFTLPSEIIKATYNLTDAAGLVLTFSILLPIFLFDSVSHGILNGLGMQTTLLSITILECLIRIFLCTVFVPKLGTSAIVLTIYAGNLFSFFSKFLCVITKTGLKIKAFEWFFLPFGITYLTQFVLRKFFLMSPLINIHLPVKILIIAGVYIVFSYISGFIKKDEILWIKSKVRKR